MGLAIRTQAAFAGPATTAQGPLGRDVQDEGVDAGLVADVEGDGVNGIADGVGRRSRSPWVRETAQTSYPAVSSARQAASPMPRRRR